MESGDIQGPSIFEDVQAGTPCSVCDLPVAAAGINHEKLEREAHISCVADLVAAGEFTAHEVVEMEKGAKLSHGLLIRHPELGGCVVCSSSLLEGDLITALTPKVSMVHRTCISTYVNGDSPNHILITVAKVNSMPWNSLVRGAVVCESCEGNVTMSPVVASSHVYHKPCFAAIYAKGVSTLIPDHPTAKAILEENGLTHAHVLDMAKVWNSLAEVRAIRKEADGILSNLWNKFKGWLSSFFEKAKSLGSAYDEAISNLEQVEGEVTSSIKTVAIEEDIQKAMALLGDLERMEQERQAKLAELMTTHAVSNLSKAKNEAMSKVGQYLGTLKSKQRRYSEALFRFKEKTHRGTFSAKKYRELVKALFASDAAMTAQLEDLESQSTSSRFTTQEVEVLADQPQIDPSVSRTSVPAGAPSQTPTRRT